MILIRFPPFPSVQSCKRFCITFFLYGGETPIWHPRWALVAFWKFEIPEDMVKGCGYPQLTNQAKKKILDGNLARLMGIDIEERKKVLQH